MDRVTDGRPRWRWFLGIGAVACAVYFLSAASAITVAGVLGTACALVTVLGVRGRTPVMWPWYLMAAGRLCFAGGDVSYWWQTEVTRTDVFPSVSDGLYLTFYVLAAAALTGMMRARRTGRDRAGLLDSLILTCGLGLLSWVYLVQPFLQDAGLTPAARAVSVAYPLADVLLIGLVIRLATGRGERSPAFRLMVAGFGVTLVGDVGYAVMQAGGGYQAGNAIDVTWLAGALLMAAAALHPSAATMTRRAGREPDGRIGPGRMLALCLAGLIAPAVLTAEWLRHRPLDVPVVVVATVTLFLLVMLRLHGVVTLLTRALHHTERQANHDQLTGLANRRLFHDRWQHELGTSAAPTALLYVDLDAFKPVNDRHGHHAGDAVLVQVGERLRSLVRAGDVVARLGGDEFAVILPHTPDAAARAVAHRLVAELSRPYVVAGLRIEIGASVGVVSAPPGADAEQTLKQADEAMYARKSARPGAIS